MVRVVIGEVSTNPSALRVPGISGSGGSRSRPETTPLPLAPTPVSPTPPAPAPTSAPTPAPAPAEQLLGGVAEAPAVNDVHDWSVSRLFVIEANIDDMPAEHTAHALQRLLAAGAKVCVYVCVCV